MSRSIRFGLAAALALAAAPALAQARRAPAKPPAAPAQPAEPAASPIVPCRTAEEVCYLGIVVGGQVAVLFTNAPNAQGIEAKPVAATGPDNVRIDMAKNEGRVVMLTGTYDPAAGITRAEVVEVAGPLASLAIKAQLAGSGNEEAAPPPKAGAPRRR